MKKRMKILRSKNETHMEKCLVEKLNTYFSQYCIMKLYVCLTAKFLMSWGVIGLEPVLISGF